MDTLATASLPIASADTGALSPQAHSHTQPQLMSGDAASAAPQDASKTPAEQAPNSNSFAAHLNAQVKEVSGPEVLDMVSASAPLSPTAETMKLAQLPQVPLNTNEPSLSDGQELPVHLQELPPGAVASSEESDVALAGEVVSNAALIEKPIDAPIEGASETLLDSRAVSTVDATAAAAPRLEPARTQQGAQSLDGELESAETAEPLTQNQPKMSEAASVLTTSAQQKSVRPVSDIETTVAQAVAPSRDDVVMDANSKPKVTEFEVLAPSSLRRDVSMPQVASTAQASVPQAPQPLPETSASSVTTGSGLKLNVEVEVQSARWGEAIGAHMTKLVRDGQRSAQLIVNPPQLGPVEVSVNVDNEHATVNFSAPTSAARDALESALPRLREMLAEGGFSSADVDVSSGGEHESAERDGSAASGSGAGTNAAADEPGESDLSVKRNLSVGLLDTYV